MITKEDRNTAYALLKPLTQTDMGNVTAIAYFLSSFLVAGNEMAIDVVASLCYILSVKQMQRFVAMEILCGAVEEEE